MTARGIPHKPSLIASPGWGKPGNTRAPWSDLFDTMDRDDFTGAAGWELSPWQERELGW